MSQKRSIKDFFRPVPPTKKPTGEGCEVFDGDLIIVAPPVVQSKRRKVWSPQVSQRLQDPSQRATASPTPTPSTGRLPLKVGTPNAKPDSSKPAALQSPKALPVLEGAEPKDHDEEELNAAADASLEESIDSSMAPGTSQSHPTSSGLSNARTSFGSLPHSSQSTASKRVISHGEEVVKGSDTDTDSDSSLEDVASFFPKRIAHPSVVITKPPPHIDPISVRTRTKNGVKKSIGKAGQIPKTHAFSLDNLVAQSRKEVALKAKVADAKARIEERAISPAQPNVQLDKGRLASLIGGAHGENEGEAQRVLEALARTDALEMKEVWHFFGQRPQDVSNPFPSVSTGDPKLDKVLNDPGRREKMLLSGAIPSWASRRDLPSELLIWMLGQVCLERKESILQKCIATLKNSARHLSSIFTPAQLEKMFGLLGAPRANVNTSTQIVPTKVIPSATLRQISANLFHVATLLSILASVLPADTKSLAIDLLARASFDESVLADGHLHTGVEEAVASLIMALPDLEAEEKLHDIGRSLFSSISSPVLRHQLVASLPYSPYSNPRVHHFRRRLALAFALNSSRWLNEDITKPSLTARVLYSLAMSPAYKIKPSTDYVVLGATLNLLDIAIDAGFSDLAFLKRKSRKDVSEKNMVRPRQDEVDPRETEFNANIDLIVKEIRSLTAKVVDTGATHMHRTEVKSVAERMIQRLECAVRTRERILKNHYDRDEGDAEVMTKFFSRTVEKDAESTPNGEVQQGVETEQSS